MCITIRETWACGHTTTLQHERCEYDLKGYGCPRRPDPPERRDDKSCPRCEEQINRHDPSSEFYWETTDKKKAAERNAAMEKRAAAFKKAAAEKQADDQYNDDPIAKESLERWKEAEGR